MEEQERLPPTAPDASRACVITAPHVRRRAPPPPAHAGAAMGAAPAALAVAFCLTACGPDGHASAAQGAVPAQISEQLKPQAQRLHGSVCRRTSRLRLERNWSSSSFPFPEAI